MSQRISEELVRIVKERARKEGGVVALARSLNINKGLVSLAYNGEYMAPSLRIALELPNTKPAQTCTCGEVHVTPWCTKEQGAPVKETEVKVVYVEVEPKPKPKKKRKPAPYRTLAFRFYDDAAFDRARRFVDAGGDRTARLLELIDEHET